LFAFGGVGDMNSLIAKTVYAKKNDRKNVDMFLNPNSVKDYLYVDDYCRAVMIGCVNGLFGDDFNIAAETPYVTSEIMQMIQDEIKMDLSEVVKWHPKTDYLGNHRLSSSKFRKSSGWIPHLSLKEGIKKSVQQILHDESGYDPLVHLDAAKLRDVDLTEFFNR